MRHVSRLMSSIFGALAFAAGFLAPAVCLAVTAAGTWWTLRLLKRQRGVAANIAELGQIILLLTFLPMLLWAAGVELPSTAAALSQAVRLLKSPSPAWRVWVDGTVLHVKGDFGDGLAPAVEHAIRSEEHTS